MLEYEQKEGLTVGIGKQIRAGRERLGLTQGELAKQLGITKSAVGNYENEVSHPKEPVLYKLFLKLEFSKLIDKFGLKAPQGDAPAEAAGIISCESEIVTTPTRAEELLALWQERDQVSVLALPSLDGVCAAWGTPEDNRAALFFCDKKGSNNHIFRPLLT